ncbi:MAG: tyrosine-type recombinase/integrase [Planctomycetota bacterium]
MSIIKCFFSWLVKTNAIQMNPAGEVESPRSEKRLPRNYLSVEEVEQVLAQPDISTPTGFRDRCAMEVFFSTGIRRKELRNLDIRDIDFRLGTVFVKQGKGKRDRLSAIEARALQWLRKYIYDIRPALLKGPDTGALFLSVLGGRIGLQTLTQMGAKYLDQAELGKRGAVHIWRHSCATLMLEGGADVRFVQAQLGHECLNSTMIYTNIAISKLKEVHRRTHPGGGDVPSDNSLPSPTEQE